MRKASKHFLLVATLLFIAFPLWGAPETVVLLVRHAEKVLQGDDPGLTAAGLARTQRLIKVLSDLEIDAVYSTQFKRTRTTAEPIAKARGLKVELVPAGKDYAAQMSRILRARKRETVLVVSHSNTIPEILRELGIPAPPEITEKEYDRLFVCFLPETGPPHLISLRFP